MRTLFPILISAIVFLAASSPGDAQAQTKSATLHQVVAGVSKYAPASGQKDLALAHKDAADMAAHWTRHGANVFANVRGDALLDQNATREKILGRLDEVIANARAGDWAIIFLAGHGGPNPSHAEREWCFFAHDAAIRANELQDRIARLDANQVTVLLILDTCFSGMMAAPRTKAVVMAACRDDELSGEPAVLRNGQFTQALIAGLAGSADTNKDGRITVATLRSYVTPQVARHSNNRQTPLFWVPPGKLDELPLPTPGRQSVATALGNTPIPINAERIVDWLKARGHQAHVTPKGTAQGKTVSAVIVEDGWRFEISIRFSTDERAAWFSTVLRPANGLTIQQMQSLMKKTSEQACMDVFIVDRQGNLCLETPNARLVGDPPFSVSEVFFQRLNRHLRTIRDSHDLWKLPAAK
ncbi:MAG: caspase family protein [Planctomycetes bacterium]|nr:caspase family protein [Planctomycetota bacterium]